MGQIKTVIHTFDNYYTHGKDYITFYYYIQNGFASIKEAEEFVMSAGEDPEWYVFSLDEIRGCDHAGLPH